jgi:hypothetical protein
MSINSSHLNWALNKKPKKEHAFFSSFVRRFDLSDKESAIRAYMALLESPRIRNRRQEKLKRSFKNFQDHHQEKFWSERNLQVNTEVVLNQAGVIVQDGGLLRAKEACEKLFSGSRDRPLDQEPLDEYEDDSEDDSEDDTALDDRASLHDGKHSFFDFNDFQFFKNFD